MMTMELASYQSSGAVGLGTTFFSFPVQASSVAHLQFGILVRSTQGRP